MHRWTKSECDYLIQAWPRHSARVVAKALGTTRNAVIGKAHRLGLPGKPHLQGRKLMWAQAQKARRMAARGLSPSTIARRFCVDPAAVRRLLSGETYKCPSQKA
ncbi:MAG: hypothetical protein KGL35_15270 [Bradyrhizobium sp.]|nr:hypothetical protein [Bradyrhizobium sp.]